MDADDSHRQNTPPQPSCCEGCTDGSAPLYRLNLTLAGKGWETTSRWIWLCASCQHKLAFEYDFLFRS